MLYMHETKTLETFGLLNSPALQLASICGKYSADDERGRGDAEVEFPMICR